MYKVYLGCGFQQGDNIGITSSTCRHCTLSNSVICSDSYPIPILSLFFLYHPYIPYFLNQRIFHFLVLTYCIWLCLLLHINLRHRFIAWDYIVLLMNHALFSKQWLLWVTDVCAFCAKLHYHTHYYHLDIR